MPCRSAPAAGASATGRLYAPCSGRPTPGGPAPPRPSLGGMPEPETVPLTPEQKAARAASFGGAASHYERYRPGPPVEAVDWILPRRVHSVVDLGAGTGALTLLLVGRAGEGG